MPQPPASPEISNPFSHINGTVDIQSGPKPDGKGQESGLVEVVDAGQVEVKAGARGESGTPIPVDPQSTQIEPAP